MPDAVSRDDDIAEMAASVSPAREADTHNEARSNLCSMQNGRKPEIHE